VCKNGSCFLGPIWARWDGLSRHLFERQSVEEKITPYDAEFSLNTRRLRQRGQGLMLAVCGMWSILLVVTNGAVCSAGD